MTELSTPDESAAAQPSPDWPLDSQPAVTDQLVQQALAPLDALPGVPVAEHEAVYDALHDELRTALDSDPTISDPTIGDPTIGDPTIGDPSDGGA
ncbi:hypothetical protein FBY31_0041 [Arthrobacter sp. SLBN-100]|uniref:hypothetical protein n=1 Tax=Arthrobacter sp. SLBN-100 TaxID=2768450 RepID=UPI001166612F|nr:hypothetical protein [Arthrobacter sp. SLBN-100]TQJ66051.1 hypothetical protein FBY31_0041 [Arthrobacter sp. SLBN-100]